MRFVILGAGAIGGVVGARLHQAGYEVLLITRDAHYHELAAHGLTLETPLERVALPIPVVPSPAEVGFGDTDIVLLSTKSQDTEAALLALACAAPREIPIVCLQNEVENERIAPRYFGRAYGARDGTDHASRARRGS